MIAAIIFLTSLTSTSFALDVNEEVGYTSNALLGNSVETHIHNIRDLIRACTVQPYSYDQNHVKVIHELQSHCPEIKPLRPLRNMPRVKITIGSHHFVATLQESESSDGDFYDVEIRDAISNDSFHLSNVLAYGDVLVGILNGDTSGIKTKYTTQSLN